MRIDKHRSKLLTPFTNDGDDRASGLSTTRSQCVMCERMKIDIKGVVVEMRTSRFDLNRCGARRRYSRNRVQEVKREAVCYSQRLRLFVVGWRVCIGAGEAGVPRAEIVSEPSHEQ